jgi:hypothetical protein
MSSRFTAILLMLVSVFALQSCLVESPTSNPVVPGGEDTLVFQDTVPDTLPPTERYLAKGQQHVRNGQFGEAMAAFDTAILFDSSNSQAYYGHAKATLRFYKVDNLSLLEDFEAMSADPSTFALLDHPDSVLTLRLQATSRVRKKMAILMERDSLTRWYRYLTDSTPSEEALADPSYSARRAFIQDYLLKADLGVPGYRSLSKFPLSDFRIPAKSLMLDFAYIEMTYVLTRLYDLDGNDTLDARDALMRSLQFGSSGSFSIDSLSSIEGDLEGDSATTHNLNQLIAGMQSGLLGTSQLAALIGGGSGSDSGSGIDSAVSPPEQNLDSIIASLGETILFYQFGDKKDNDGDGCIDEEILDEKDNDLDGFVDEDARVIPADKPDGVDNNRDGRMDPVNPPYPHPAGNDTLGREALVGSSIHAARPHLLGFVHNYLNTTYQGGTKELDLPNPDLTTWVKIKKNASNADMALRLAVQRDSLAIRIPPGGPVPDSLTVKLANAKSVIGGCWLNY